MKTFLFAAFVLKVVLAGPGEQIWVESPLHSGQCGPTLGYSACSPDQCCSAYGWCGSSDQYCNAKSLWVGPEVRSSLINTKPTSSNAQQRVPTNPITERGRVQPVALQQRRSFVPALNWCGNHKVVALTFDDGPIEGHVTAPILDELAQYNIKATFFLSPFGPSASYARRPGSNGQCLLLKRMLEEGHSVAGHTMRHVDLSKMSNEQIKKEIDDYNGWYNDCTGSEPEFRGIRPPFGYLRPDQRAYINSLGITVVTWNADSNDWVIAKNGAEAVYERTKERFRRIPAGGSMILLQHDASYIQSLIPRYLEFFRNLGYSFVNLDQCINLCTSTSDCKFPDPNNWPGVYDSN